MAAEIKGTTKLCALVGDPVEHTLSPAMHNAAFEYLGIDLVYIPFRVTRENLGDAVQGLVSLDCTGFNVTIPHKIAVIPLLDEVDETAARVGAVNTVVIKNRQTRGYNTDGDGFLKALRSETLEPSGKSVVMLGAGGAARSIAYALVYAGAHLTILNRTPEKAVGLADDVARDTGNRPGAGGLTGDSLEELLSCADILVNTTSAGMVTTGSANLVPEGLLRPGLAVCDIIYNPPETGLLKLAKAAGCRTMNGIGMLVHQGALAFELWTGRPAPTDVMMKTVLAELGVA